MMEKDAAHVPKTIHPFKNLHINTILSSNKQTRKLKKKRSRSFSSINSLSLQLFDTNHDVGYTSDSYIGS